ncbi:hypothetical protein M422DRAFT_243904 [Sphaerobolus stellatus SS14]|nr:hypothetical protein M422DRAFT_243904 [Sphaerobolus stellatus SS14]
MDSSYCTLRQLAFTDSQIEWLRGYHLVWYLNHSSSPDADEFAVMVKLFVKCFRLGGFSKLETVGLALLIRGWWSDQNKRPVDHSGDYTLPEGACWDVEDMTGFTNEEEIEREL